MSVPDFALAMVESARVLAFDVETTGLDAHKDRVCGYVVANASHSLYIPVRHQGGNMFADPVPFERELARAFAKRSRLGLRTIGFAIHFDLWMAAKEGVLLGPPLEDCQLNEVLLRDDRGKAYDLDTRAKDYGLPGKAEGALYEALQPFALEDKGKRAREPGRHNMAYFHRLPGDHPLVIEYAEGDGRTTFDLWEKQQPLLDATLGAGENLRRVWKLESDLIPYIAAVRRRGLKVDIPYGVEATDRVNEEKTNRRRAMNVPADFKSKSPLQVANWLFDNGVTFLPTTPTGKWSTRRSVLERLEAGRRVLDLRKCETVQSGFITPLTQKHAQNGRVHPELVQSANGMAGTHTGRFSSREPNMQAVPKRDKFLGQIVRPLILPDEGMLIGEADVSQQEPRMYAHIAREPVLLKGYNATPFVDVHTITAQLLGINRDSAKTLGLSLFNGMGAVTLSERLNIPAPDARKLRWDFFDAYPYIRRFTQDAPEIARERGYVRTILGRRAYFDDNFHMAVSRVIQGSAADQMKTALLQALQYCEATPDIQILLTIHDSILFQCRIGTDLSEFRRVIEDMRNLYQIENGKKIPMRIPFPVEIGLGRDWSQASYGPKT